MIIKIIQTRKKRRALNLILRETAGLQECTISKAYGIIK